MIPHNRVVLRQSDHVAVTRVLLSGQIGQGPEVEAFERELAERFRPGDEAACVSSGTAALRLAIKVLGLEHPYIPTYACSALYHVLSRGIPCDCDPETLCSPDADMVVHTYGVPCPMGSGAIEDFTHAPGGNLDGQPCGSLGVLSVISFGATKPLGIGAGGAVLGHADAIAEIKDRRDYDGKRDLRERFNWQMSDLHAAIGRSRLKRLDEENAWRVATAKRYGQELGYIPYRYIIRVPEPQDAIRFFAARGVQAINPLEPWELLHRQLGLDHARFPNAEAAAASTVSLPIWPGMTTQEVDEVAEALEAYERHRSS